MNGQRLSDLFRLHGQSPWLDNLQRTMLQDGSLTALIAAGVRGLTSNPTIFQQAIEGSDAYHAQFRELASSGASIESAYWSMVCDDIAAAADAFLALHRDSDGGDGFVSVEVDPRLAHDEHGTVAAALELARRLQRDNVMIKIPATDAGIGAIRRVLAAGISVNVTLIFGADRHSEVMEAHLLGLEDLARSEPNRLRHVASVASFFISRVDGYVDPIFTAGSSDAQRLAGTVAVDQAKVAYRNALNLQKSGRWEQLAAAGAQPQRLLWASTSTKNPVYPDTKYVDELIGPGTVNTLPDATLRAFADHGRLQRTIDVDVESSESRLAAAGRHGVDLAGVAATLEERGVATFAKSFTELLDSLRAVR